MKACGMNMKKKGSSSIMVMLIMLVLVVFGVLALMSSYSDLKLSKKSADWHVKYYQLDAKGERFLSKVDTLVRKAALTSTSGQGQTAYVAATLLELKELEKEYKLTVVERNDGVRVSTTIEDDDGNKLGIMLDSFGYKECRENSSRRLCSIVEWKQLAKEFNYDKQNELWNGEVNNP